MCITPYSKQPANLFINYEPTVQCRTPYISMKISIMAQVVNYIPLVSYKLQSQLCEKFGRWFLAGARYKPSLFCLVMSTLCVVSNSIKTISFPTKGIFVMNILVTTCPQKYYGFGQPKLQNQITILFLVHSLPHLILYI